jgi:hypothetical protein
VVAIPEEPEESVEVHQELRTAGELDCRKVQEGVLRIDLERDFRIAEGEERRTGLVLDCTGLEEDCCMMGCC